MAQVYKCDKCGEIFTNFGSSGGWNSDEPFNINKKKLVKVKKEVITVSIQIKTSSIKRLELCNKCGFEIVRKKVK